MTTLGSYRSCLPLWFPLLVSLYLNEDEDYRIGHRIKLPGCSVPPCSVVKIENTDQTVGINFVHIRNLSMCMHQRSSPAIRLHWHQIFDTLTFLPSEAAKPLIFSFFLLFHNCRDVNAMLCCGG